MIELLVVIAIIAILAALLLPGLSRAKQQAQGAKCESNCHELILAWTMYASENREVLPNNIGDSSEYGGWVNGNLSEVPNNPDNTNYFFMMGGAASITQNGTSAPATTTTIGAYTKSPGIYQCPADPVLAPGYGVARVRSYSMNFACGSKSTAPETAGVYGDYWPDFFKTTDLKITTKTWVLSEEHPDSLNDGIQYTPTSDGEDAEWGDLPASYHNGACGYAFADGHAEIHKWLNHSTIHAVIGVDNWLPLVVVGSKVDIDWVESRCSPRASGAVNQVPGP